MFCSMAASQPVPIMDRELVLQRNTTRIRRDIRPQSREMQALIDADIRLHQRRSAPDAHAS
jgi:hypothetical protein